MSNASMGKRSPEKQGHRTPDEFIDAVAARFGVPTFDLAATDGHRIHTAIDHYSPEQDSLAQDWTSITHDNGEPCKVAWLNPPFSNIRPWVAKLDEECRNLPRWTLFLVPASMGSNWWRDHVLGKSQAIGVTRMRFQGSKDMYPKDLALMAYGFGLSGHGFWDWKQS